MHNSFATISQSHGNLVLQSFVYYLCSVYRPIFLESKSEVSSYNALNIYSMLWTYTCWGC